MMHSVPSRPLRRVLAALVAGAFVAAAAATASSPVSAQSQPDAAAAAVRASVEAWLQGRFKVDGVRRSPVPGIFEVQIGTDLIYVDEKGQHGFVEGQLIDLKSNRNLTQERVDQLTAIEFKDLPLNLAIKQVIGRGTRNIAVFEDPNCGHCRNLRRELLKLTDVTIYTFTLPILTADSETKTRQAWCAKDRVKAWNELMLEGKVPNNPGTCDTPIAKVTELARKLRIHGTPTIFFANGRRVPGGLPGDQLQRMLAENSKPS